MFIGASEWKLKVKFFVYFRGTAPYKDNAYKIMRSILLKEKALIIRRVQRKKISKVGLNEFMPTLTLKYLSVTCDNNISKRY